MVKPKPTPALPKATNGNRAVAATAWLHCGLGQTVSQILEALSRLLGFPVSSGGPAQLWARLGEILKPRHDEYRRGGPGLLPSGSGTARRLTSSRLAVSPLSCTRPRFPA